MGMQCKYDSIVIRVNASASFLVFSLSKALFSRLIASFIKLKFFTVKAFSRHGNKRARPYAATTWQPRSDSSNTGRGGSKKELAECHPKKKKIRWFNN